MCSTDLNIETLLWLFWLQHCRTFTHYDLTFSLWHKIALCDFWQFKCCFTCDGPAMLRFEHVFFKIYCHYCNFRSIADETASHRDFASQNADKIAACERTFKKQSQLAQRRDFFWTRKAVWDPISSELDNEISRPPCWKSQLPGNWFIGPVNAVPNLSQFFTYRA